MADRGGSPPRMAPSSFAVLGVLLVALGAWGCPHPPPPVNPPTPVVWDAAPDATGPPDAVGCGISVSTQDAITGKVVNAAMDSEVRGNEALANLVAENGLGVVRCVVADLLLDIRGAPNVTARLKTWMVAHGGLP